MEEKDSPNNTNKVSDLELKKQRIRTKLAIDQKKVKDNSRKGIIQPKELLHFNNEPLINQNTLTLIKGQTGVHKSRLAQIITSVLITKDYDRRSSIGFKVVPDRPTYVLYVDTERDLQTQFPSAIQTIRVMAGYEGTQDVEYLEVSTLIGIARSDRLISIELVIDEERKKIPIECHLVVIVDVSSDAVGDFNQINETNPFIDMINHNITDKNVSFICIIHENPNNNHSTKARGHLGTELQNKASVVLRIAKGGVNNQFTISVEKSRSTKVPGRVSVEFNELLETLVAIPQKENDSNDLHEITRKIIDYFTNSPENEVSRKVLGRLIPDAKASTLDRKLCDFLKGKIEIEKDGTVYTLDRRKDGREVVYFLQPKDSLENIEEAE